MILSRKNAATRWIGSETRVLGVENLHRRPQWLVSLPGCLLFAVVLGSLE